MKDKNTTTIYDVAKASGVSVATVSRVINHYDQVKRQTSLKVLEAMELLSFDIEGARTNKTGKMHKPQNIRNLSGLFVISVPELSNTFYTDLINGAQTSAQKNGHHLLINNTLINHLNSDYYLGLLKSHNISGMILTETLSTTALQKVKSHFPIVQCSEYNEEIDNVSYVSINDSKTTYEMTNYFINKGYKKIAYITTPIIHQYAMRRKRGYLRALSDAGLAPNPHWMMELADIELDKSIVQITEMLSANPPEAIVAISDTFAAAAIKAAQRINLDIPMDISIMGIDDTPIARSTTPTISTVSQPRYHLGYTAFELLLKETQYPHLPSRQIQLDTSMIFRESTL